ncbi:hypothetical protein HMPREF0290_1140 [Corynebacterium efficiens YS-314]|nr:hypothetical protein HMPREF0290_1140 [Corynebacterium efficiens YS-314]
MEYEVFVAQFRQRTAARMAEFEKALAKAQGEVAKTSPGEPGRRQAAMSPPQVTPASPVARTPQQPGRGRPRGRGPVQSILRRA